MQHIYSRPPARPQYSADKVDKAKVAPRELPRKLTIWQVIAVWLAVVMVLPFVIMLMGLISGLTGASEVIPPAVFYKIAQFALLLATIFSSAVAVCSGLVFLAVQRPNGESLKLVLWLLGIVMVLGVAASLSLSRI